LQNLFIDKMQLVKILLVVIGLCTLVFGHAKLNVPPAWNPQPSKASPCGGGPQPTDTATTFTVGTTESITWQVVAGDGVGAVTLSVDPAAGTNFANGVVIGTPTAVGTYTYPYTVPSVTCTGANGLCNIQVASSSGWFACSTVRFDQPGVPVPPPPTPSCQAVSGLTFCTMINGHSIEVEPGTDPLSLDKALAVTYTATLYNANVFSNPNTTLCQTDYKNYLCHSQFPWCGQTAACQPSCYDAIGNCGITTSHRGLYDCTQGPITCNDPNASSAIVASFFVIMAALLFAMF